jgi:hypothetical protein
MLTALILRRKGKFKMLVILFVVSVLLLAVGISILIK